MAKIDRLKKNGLKAGIKNSKREGHVLTQEELLKMKVQMMPSLVQWITGAAGVAGMGMPSLRESYRLEELRGTLLRSRSCSR